MEKKIIINIKATVHDWDDAQDSDTLGEIEDNIKKLMEEMNVTVTDYDSFENN